jgi:MFS family permease
MTFAVGSVVCAVSRSFPVMIFGRSVQGLGAGGVSALTYLIVAEVISLRERPKWFSFVTIAWILGTMSGPLIGGACARFKQWVTNISDAQLVGLH